MSVSVTTEPSLVSEVLADLETTEKFDGPARRQSSALRKWILRIGFGLAVCALTAAGFASWLGKMSTKSQAALQTHAAKRGELVVTITEDGNLESADNLDIKCEVAGGSTILWIVEDGKTVTQGDPLVRLESSQLEEQISLEKIAYEKARASHIQADKDYETAKISVQEYLEGTFRQSLQDMEAKITIAMANLRSAENSLEHTDRMFRKGYVNSLQLEAQQFAVERAKLDLESAKTAKFVLEEFTKRKTLTTLNSQFSAAEAKKNSEKAAFELEEARLKRLEGYLKKCRIEAPKTGMAVYANENRGRWGNQQSEIKEGAQVRDQQTILRLPDLGKMQVKVTVHESKVERIQRGMRAGIRIQGREFQGSVISVATQPEPGSWFSAAVKEYATIVKVDGQSEHLLPGMTAEVEILVAHLKNVITVPVAAVFELAGHTFCYVTTGDKVDRRAVEVGLSNDKFVELKKGVEEGDTVVLNPRSLLTDLNSEARTGDKMDVKKKFGSSPPDGKKNSADGPPRKDGAPGSSTRPPGPGNPTDTRPAATADRGGPGANPAPSVPGSQVGSPPSGQPGSPPRDPKPAGGAPESPKK